MLWEYKSNIAVCYTYSHCCSGKMCKVHSVKLGLPSWFINQPDGSEPEGPRPHLEGAAGRDRTHVTPDAGCRSANWATDPCTMIEHRLLRNQCGCGRSKLEKYFLLMLWEYMCTVHRVLTRYTLDRTWLLATGFPLSTNHSINRYNG